MASNATPTPAMPPPPGTTSNFDHPESLKGVMNIAMGVSIPLTTIFFLLRTYVRTWVKRQWDGEDCERLPALFSICRGGEQIGLTARSVLALIAWVSGKKHSDRQKWLRCTGLTEQIGTVAFSGTGAATMAHHGGKHQWDMTRSQAKEAFYVRGQCPTLICLGDVCRKLADGPPDKILT